MSLKLSCPHGHEWDFDQQGEYEGVRATCPICGAKALGETLNLRAADVTKVDEMQKLDPKPASTVMGEPLLPPDQRPTFVGTAAGPQPLSGMPSPTAMEQTLVPPSEMETPTRLGGPDAPVSPRDSEATVHTATKPAAQATVGAHVPGYEILSELGRGGMGVVYKARQVRANRLVALKMILAGGHASRAHLERFRIEGEAVARLQHPNIVQVYEVADHEGRPYFSLEYLDGGSLSDHLDGTPWPAKAAAQLVETLALAMQHAHEKGIVHRDLKPANILLAKSEDRGSRIEDRESKIGQARPSILDPRSSILVPKITDFGLAKQMEAHTGQTQSGDVLGTPSYMAPEQAEGKISAIGPCTDVYALGAILYELVTGRPPFRGSTLMETLEQVRIQEPVSPRQLHLHAPRDLETICMKCLAKEPARRYASALELAEDLGRFRAGEPIKARPVSVAERVVRWSRRNPKVAGLLAALAFVTAVGFISVSALWLHAETQRGRAESNWNRAETQRGRAENNLKGALGAVDTYFTKTSENRLLNEPGAEGLRRDLLLAARDYYVRFVNENEQEAELQADLGKSLYRLGQILGDVESPAEGIKHHERARAIFKELVKDQPKEPAHRFDLAATLHHLGRLQREANQTDASKKHYEEALVLWEQLVREHPAEDRYKAEMARTQMGLGNLHQFRGKHKEAEERYLKGLELWQQLAEAEPKNEDYRRDLAVSHDNLASLYDLMGPAAKADQEAVQTQKILQRLVKDAPAIARYQNDLARSYFNAGKRLALRGESARARAAYRDAAGIWQRLARDYPLVVRYRASAAAAASNEADELKGQGQFAEAEKLYGQSLSIQEQLREKHPNAPDYQFGVALARSSLADLEREKQKPDAALKGYAPAIEALEALLKSQYRPAAVKPALRNAYWGQALALEQEGEQEKAAKAWERVQELSDEKQKKQAAHARAVQRIQRATVELRKDPARALAGFSQAAQELETLLREPARPPETGGTLRNAHQGRALALTEAGQHGEALKAWDRVLELTEEKQQHWFKPYRLQALARSGDHARAAGEAEALIAVLGSGEGLVRLAGVHTLAAGTARRDETLNEAERARQADRCAARAMELLREAEKKGWFKQPANVRRLQQDRAFDPLRTREDFQMLVK